MRASASDARARSYISNLIIQTAILLKESILEFQEEAVEAMADGSDFNATELHQQWQCLYVSFSQDLADVIRGFCNDEFFTSAAELNKFCSPYRASLRRGLLCLLLHLRAQTRCPAAHLPHNPCRHQRRGVVQRPCLALVNQINILPQVLSATCTLGNGAVELRGHRSASVQQALRNRLERQLGEAASGHVGHARPEEIPCEVGRGLPSHPDGCPGHDS